MKKTIEFKLLHDFPGLDITPPQPAKKLMPQWFKSMPRENEDDDTVKKCIPFIDAMTAGYIITTHIDIILNQTPDGKLHLKYLGDYHKKLIDKWPPIETHPERQVPNSPLTSSTVLKYMNPWRISTPKNYSLIFTQLMNRYESKLIPISGLVDTDMYKNVVNIPFIHLDVYPGGPEIHIPVGTPVCQIIPVKRDEWAAQTRINDGGDIKETVKQRTEMTADRAEWYRRKIHQKKSFN